MRVVRATSPVTSVFTRPAFMSSAVVPPTSGVNTSFDSPKVPWQEAHFPSHTRSPLATLPEPGGRPLKSGRTSMSHAAISAGVAMRPTPGYGPAHAAEARASNIIAAADKSARGRASSRIESVNLHIANLAAVGDLPRLDGVVVVDRARAAHRAQLVDLRLDVTGLVDRARLQDRGSAVPRPVDVEAREGLGEDGIFQPRRAPVAPAVGGHVDSLYFAAARPCETRDVVKALIEQELAARGRGDDRLALLDRGVLPQAAVGHEIDIVQRFVLRRPGLIAHFESPQPLHPRHALDARSDQSQGIAVFGAQHFAIHGPGDHHVVERALHRDGAREARAVGALGEHEPARLAIEAAVLKER